MTLFEYLFQHAAERPYQKVLTDDVREVNYKELLEEITDRRNQYFQQGISEGKKVILQMRNCVEWVICFFSLLSVGSIIVPISPNISKKEFEDIVAGVSTNNNR